MNNLSAKLLNQKFSHIYIESSVVNSGLAEKILSHFPQVKTIVINHYKDIFCRPRQDVRLQKKSPKLILAEQKPPFLYTRAKPCHHLDHNRFFYTTEILNCLFDCEYCFLQGLYPSGNIVIFLNRKELEKAVTKELKNGPFMLSVSYNSDLLVFEKLTGFVDRWVDFAQEHPAITIELRTKSSITYPFLQKSPIDNFQLSWTLAPNRAINLFEKHTPSAESRIKAIKQSINAGWKIRLCFDPVILFPNWQQEYQALIEEVFNEVDNNYILDATIGPFRMAKEHLKQARKRYPTSPLLAYPYHLKNGIYEYPTEITQQITDTISGYLSPFLPKKKIYLR